MKLGGSSYDLITSDFDVKKPVITKVIIDFTSHGRGKEKGKLKRAQKAYRIWGRWREVPT